MEPKQDPLELWVGAWVPVDAIDREARKLSKEEPAPSEPESSAKES